MSIGISEEHVELARSLREWAASLGGREAARDAEGDAEATFADTWKACVEMGVATIGLPEAYGGGGGSVLDQAVALEACAHELVPGPLLSTAVAALVAPVRRDRRRRRGGPGPRAPDAGRRPGRRHARAGRRRPGRS